MGKGKTLAKTAPAAKGSASHRALTGSDPRFQTMLYSRDSHPISFRLFDDYPEFHDMRDLLPSYEPRAPGEPA